MDIEFNFSDVQTADINNDGILDVIADNYYGAVFDLAGRQVYSVSDSWPVGEHSVTLPALSSGTYMIRLSSSEFTQTGRFVLLD